MIARQDQSGDWSDAFVARQNRVLEHYQQVLARGSVPSTERDAIHSRMRRVAMEIQQVAERGTNGAMPAELTAA